MGVVLAGLLLAVVVGCARQAPVTTSEPATSPAVAALRIGATSDPASRVLAELYLQALAGKSRPGSVVDVGDDVNTQVSRLMADELDVVPAFAWSAAQGLKVDAQDPQTLVSDLAAALDGEVAVLQPSKVDRAWRYVAGRADVSLLDLTKKTKLVAPQAWRQAPDGQAGLAAIYQVKPSVTVVADAGQRLARVKAGAIGVFDGTEPQGWDAAVKPVGDPKTMIASDPQVALLRLGLAEDVTVLDVIQQLHGTLDNTAIAGIRTRAAAVGVPAAVTEWLAAHPLK
ncbi:MAG: hypothetical protein QM582_03805 [Micropruina sp.]|uniref:hypothetical protein n=1 Tax=Micropruina sp. TaxID=2737536 RepID=UPI0039E5D281